MKYVLACVFLLGGCVSQPVEGATQPTKAYREWRANVQHEALAQGISAETIRDALSDVVPDDRVVRLDGKQPEKAISFDVYLNNILSTQRIDDGRRLLIEYSAPLEGLSRQYGIPPEIIVALWGIESNFGKLQGRFSVIRSLVTLSYEGRRAAFFRGELMNALRILDQEKLSSEKLRGSWAGAMGQCQFMPSTYVHYAVDGDGDGLRDIWSNKRDVLASMAHYLSAEGWGTNQSWGAEVQLTRAVPEHEIGLATRHTVSEWMALGVHISDEVSRVIGSSFVSLVQPDGADGRSFIVYDSYRALMKWNRSTYFATAVGLLADRIKE